MIKKILVPVAAAGIAFAAMGLNNELEITEYVIESPKVKKQTNLVFLSDIHSARFKDGGRELFKKIDSLKPDCIILGGDVFDKYSSDSEIESTYELVRNLVLKYKECFFITGNHELECKKTEEIKERLLESGVKVLGEESFITADDILIGGTDYVAFGEEDVICQKQKLIERSKESGLFTVLVRHVPMSADGDGDVDLILSGHNHGGLWRIPKTQIGAAGGGGKILPRYVHGKYYSHATPMIVGSGITTYSRLLPRLYNPPEIVGVSIIPNQTL